jgi:hypothetical protein
MSEPRPPTRFQWDTADLAVFDPVIAHAACWSSYYAYYDQAHEWFRKLMGASFVTRFPADPATGRPGGYALTVDEGNLIVFAGTTDAQQLYGICRDAVFGTITNQPATMQGMYGVAQWAQWILDHFGGGLQTMMHTNKTIFAGHSIGGALAVVLLATLRGATGPSLQPNTAYTFGSPNAGNESFASYMRDVFSVMNVGDPIPKLPPFGYFRLGNGQATPPSFTVCPPNTFMQHGNLVYLRPGSEAEIVEPGTHITPKDSPIEWDAVRFGADTFVLGSTFDAPKKVVQVWNESIQAHECREYLDRLEKLLPVVSGQHATMGDDGKKAEGVLPLAQIVLNAFNAVLAVQTPPPVSGPSGPASQGVVPLTAKRRH